ncbi:hypothetical protein [Flavobacterium sp.]|uniref:hypothetical protein n=1 Tax=Flavobacterium sp. TaxID=239 RepID=UPI003D0AB515
MKFEIKALDSKNFVLYEKQKQLASLTYDSSFSKNCGAIRINDTNNATFKNKSLLSSEIQFLRDKQIIFSVNKNWSGVLEICSNVNKNYFFLKTKNFWKNSKVLLDEKGKELIILTKKYNWMNWNYEYSFDVLCELDELAEMELFLFTLMQGEYLNQMRSTFFVFIIVWITMKNN